MARKCAGTLLKQGVGFNPSTYAFCDNPPGPRNPNWCGECDEKRIARISKELDDLVAQGE